MNESLGQSENDNNNDENGNYAQIDDRGEAQNDWREQTSFMAFNWVNVSDFHPLRSPRPQLEIEYFQLFFTDSLLAEILSETNRYAKEQIQNHTALKKNNRNGGLGSQ